jgi:hypothetical protein
VGSPCGVDVVKREKRGHGDGGLQGYCGGDGSCSQRVGMGWRGDKRAAKFIARPDGMPAAAPGSRVRPRTAASTWRMVTTVCEPGTIVHTGRTRPGVIGRHARNARNAPPGGMVREAQPGDTAARARPGGTAARARPGTTMFDAWVVRAGSLTLSGQTGGRAASAWSSSTRLRGQA